MGVFERKERRKEGWRDGGREGLERGGGEEVCFFLGRL